MGQGQTEKYTGTKTDTGMKTETGTYIGTGTEKDRDGDTGRYIDRDMTGTGQRQGYG